MTIHISGLAKLAAIALFAGSTLVQAADHGTFHLPFQARWGNAVLSPGDYTLDLPAPAVGNWNVRVISDSGKSVYEMPMYTELTQLTDSSKLILTNINGQYVVTELRLGVIGKDYAFAVSKSIRKLTSATPSRSADKLALAIH